jgi:nitrogen fixation-related uncharacterized protein
VTIIGVLIVVVLIALLAWILTNDQRRENEKRRANRALLERLRPEDEPPKPSTETPPETS